MPERRRGRLCCERDRNPGAPPGEMEQRDLVAYPLCRRDRPWRHCPLGGERSRCRADGRVHGAVPSRRGMAAGRDRGRGAVAGGLRPHGPAPAGLRRRQLGPGVVHHDFLCGRCDRELAAGGAAGRECVRFQAVPSPRSFGDSRCLDALGDAGVLCPRAGAASHGRCDRRRTPGCGIRPCGRHRRGLRDHDRRGCRGVPATGAREGPHLDTRGLAPSHRIPATPGRGDRLGHRRQHEPGQSEQEGPRGRPRGRPRTGRWTVPAWCSPILP